MSRPYITGHVLNQYMTDEDNPDFYFRLLAWMAVNELTYWNWSDQMILKDIRSIAAETGIRDPVLGARLHQVLRRWTARAFILGMRSLSSEAGIPIDFDFILPREGRTEVDHNVPWGERREIDPQDFFE